VTGVAGYVGLVIGVGLLELVAFALRSTGAQMPYFLNPELDFHAAIAALALLVTVGMLAGLMPALHAAKITPTEAMKAE
jgi:putative ABC transport system permease protein